MTDDNFQRCSKCGQPKTAAKSGSLTQWINVCGCDQLDTQPEEQATSIQFCALCSKRISTERKGSLTQFIFRSDLCRCEHPQAVSRSIVVNDLAAAEPVESMRLEAISDEELERIASSLSLHGENFPLDRYSPIRSLGKGAFGSVYLARDRALKKDVAIKCLHLLSSKQLVAFQNEARNTSRLKHEGIVSVFDFGATTGSVPFMVMEHIEGTSLETFLRDRGRLEPILAVEVIAQTADALASAHKMGVFHRDVKPSNIILEGVHVLESEPKKVRVKLIDFGVATFRPADQSVTYGDGSSMVGTPLYMAPELAKKTKYGEAAEVYSLGCVLFECLSGEPPFNSPDIFSIIQKHRDDPPPSLPEYIDYNEMEQIVLKCLEKNPDDRYPSMSRLRDDLRRLDFAPSLSVRATTTGASPEQLTAAVSKPKGPPVPFLIVLTALLVLGGAAVSVFTILKDSSKPSSSSEPGAGVATRNNKHRLSEAEERFDDITSMKKAVDHTYNDIALDDRFISSGKGTAQRFREFLKTHRSVRTIMIQGDEFTAIEAKQIADLNPTLLSLCRCPSIDDQCMKELGKLRGTPSLSLDNNPQITPIGLASLAHARGLTELTIKECDLDDDDMKELAKLKVDSLDIRRNPRVTAKGLREFGKAQQVRIRIAGCQAASQSGELSQLRANSLLEINTQP